MTVWNSYQQICQKKVHLAKVKEGVQCADFMPYHSTTLHHTTHHITPHHTPHHITLHTTPHSTSHHTTPPAHTTHKHTHTHTHHIPLPHSTPPPYPPPHTRVPHPSHKHSSDLVRLLQPALVGPKQVGQVVVEVDVVGSNASLLLLLEVREQGHPRTVGLQGSEHVHQHTQWVCRWNYYISGTVNGKRSWSSNAGDRVLWLSGRYLATSFIPVWQ